MAIRLEDKKAIVAEVNETAGTALSVVLADYRGVTSGDMTALRAKARAENVRLKVVRNNLAKIAIRGTEFECILLDFAGLCQQTHLCPSRDA